eukprot:403349219
MWILENTPISPFIKIVGIAPLTQLRYYNSSQANVQIAISTLVIIMRTISFYIYQKVLVLRYQNDLIPWSKPAHIAVILDYIQHCLLVVFICQENVNVLLSILFQLIIMTISSIKVYLMIKKPYFFDLTLALIKLNMDTFKICYFFSAMIMELMELNNTGFGILIILSLIFIQTSINIINIKYQDKLVINILNSQIKSPSDCEYAIYFVLNLVFQKTNNHFSNEYDGILHSFEMNQHLKYENKYSNLGNGAAGFQQTNTTVKIGTSDYYGQGWPSANKFQNRITEKIKDKFRTQIIEKTHMNYSKKMEEYYQEYIDIQMEYMNRGLKPENAGEEGGAEGTVNGQGLSEYNAQSMYFNSQIISGDSMNFKSEDVIDERSILNQECLNHTLAECFSFESLKLQRMHEMDNIKSGGKNTIDKMRDREEQMIKDKINFIAENLLAPYMKENPDNIPLMFQKCYLSLIHLQNRFICLTVITAIENLNKGQKYLDQIENKINQQYILEIILKEQSKANDQMDSTQLLNYNLKINDYFDLLLKASLSISEFWQLLSQDFNYKQIMKLEKLSLKISEILRQIKQTIGVLEKDTPLLQVSEQILFFTAIFYQMALRDMYLSDYYFKQITQNRSLISFQNMKTSFITFDEISVAIVDGNFTQMGKLLYANKILLRHLGFKAEEVVNQTVHLLMPREIALVHDKFWNRFKETGIASILEQERLLCIKDKNGYVYPFNIFIKFIYHQEYGYTFLGIFRKQQKMILAEADSSIKMNSIFFFITNHQGKITEISQSCSKYIGLSQNIFEALTAFLEEGLHPHHFNTHLSLDQLDFSKGSCVLINKALIDTSIVFKHNKELEYEIDPSNLHRIKPKMQVSIKIVKESYGLGDVSVYYFMFALFKEQTIQTIKEGLYEKLMIRANNAEEESYELNRFTDSMATRSLASFAGNNNSQSMSSCSVSSTLSNGFEELKYLEDNIDYSKTPRSLLIVKLIFNTIIIMIISLTVTLLALNQLQINQQIQQLGILKTSNENMLLLSELSILSRSFININLGLEPVQNTFTSDRKRTIQEQSLEIIENLRSNQKELDFTSNQDDNPKLQDIDIFEKSVNGSISTQNRHFNFALNSFIVKILELFGFNIFTSKEMSYLDQLVKPRTAKDITVYYVIMNTNEGLRAQTRSYAKIEGEYVLEKNQNFLDVTRIFMIVASCTIFVGVLAALYFYSKIIDNQAKTLAIFSELDRGIIDYCFSGTVSFFQFLSNDNESVILQDSQVIQQRKDLKLKEIESALKQLQEKRKKQSMVQKSGDLDGMEDQESGDGNKMGKKKKSAKNATQSGNTFQTTVNQNPLETSDAGLLQNQRRKSKFQKVFFDDFKDNESRDHKGKSQKEDNMSSQFNNTKKLMGGKRTLKDQEHRSTHNLAEILQNQKTDAKNKLRQLNKQMKTFTEEDSVVKIMALDDKNLKYRQSISQDQPAEIFESEPSSNSQTADLKQISMQWKIKTMSLYGVFFLFISSIFVAYFLIQYIIVEKVYTKMHEHTINMMSLYEGQSCMNWFITDLREMQIRNDTSILTKYNGIYDSEQSVYDKCTRQIAEFNLWLGSHIENYEIKNLNTQINRENQICSLLASKSAINEESCRKIYTGIMMKSFYQIQSVFMHDTLQAQITFVSSKDKQSQKFLNSTISSSVLIEMIDAKQQYLSKMNQIIANTLHDSLSADEISLHKQQLYVFGIYIFALFASLLVLNCFVFVQMRKSIWNSKIIFKLLPIEELNIDFKRRIQTFLFRQ